MFIAKKPVVPIFLHLALAFPLFLILTACGNQQPPPPPYRPSADTVLIPNFKDTSALAAIDHSIPKGEIMTFRREFEAQRAILRKANPQLFITESEGFNKTQILDLLKDPKCVGIRIYYGVLKGDKQNDLRMILVGTDSQGKDLFITKPSGKASTRVTQDAVGLEYGQCCHGESIE